MLREVRVEDIGIAIGIGRKPRQKIIWSRKGVQKKKGKNTQSRTETYVESFI